LAGPVNLSRPSLLWSPQEDEGIQGPPPPYLPVPFSRGSMARIERLRMGVEMIRTGFQLFHTSTIVTGSVEPIRDGENITIQESNGVPIESSSEESVALASDDGGYEGNEADLYE